MYHKNTVKNPSYQITNARIYEVHWNNEHITYHLVGLRTPDIIPIVSNNIIEYNFDSKKVITISACYEILEFNKDPHDMLNALELWYNWNNMNHTLSYNNVSNKFNL